MALRYQLCSVCLVQLPPRKLRVGETLCSNKRLRLSAQRSVDNLFQLLADIGEASPRALLLAQPFRWKLRAATLPDTCG